MNKKIIILATTVSITTIFSSVVFAETLTVRNSATLSPTVTRTTTMTRELETSRTPSTTPADTEKFTNLKERLIREIQRRIDMLNNAVTTIDSIKQITNSDKTVLKTKLSTEIITLQNLLKQVQSTKTLDELKTIVTTANNEYKKVMLFTPAVKLLAAADKLMSSADKYSISLEKIKLLGQETNASINNYVSIAENSIADAKNKASVIITNISNLDPANISDINLYIKNGKEQIMLGLKDLAIARSNMAQAIAAIKKLEGTSS